MKHDQGKPGEGDVRKRAKKIRKKQFMSGGTAIRENRMTNPPKPITCQREKKSKTVRMVFGDSGPVPSVFLPLHYTQLKSDHALYGTSRG